MTYKQPRNNMTYNVPFKKDKKETHSKPYKIVNRLDSESGSMEVWQLPKSQYGIQYNENSKKWRVMEVYINKDGEIRTRGDLPYKDYDSYLEALDHIEYNYKIESKF